MDAAFAALQFNFSSFYLGFGSSNIHEVIEFLMWPFNVIELWSKDNNIENKLNQILLLI